MPVLFYCKCNKCDFKTNIGFGVRMYVKDENGNKVVCGHPLEESTISKVLGIPSQDASAWLDKNYEKISDENRKKLDMAVGMDSDYICLDCFDENYIDNLKEKIKCKNCGSKEMIYIFNLNYKMCPKCKKGIINLVDAGMA